MPVSAPAKPTSPRRSRFRFGRRTRLRPVGRKKDASFRAALPWLLGSLFLTLLPLVGQVPAWTLLLFGVCTGWRYWIETQERPLPSLVLRILLFLPVAFLIFARLRFAPPTPRGC